MRSPQPRFSLAFGPDLLVATVTETSYADTAVQSARTYAYAVRALDAAGNLGPAGAVTIKTPKV